MVCLRSGTLSQFGGAMEHSSRPTDGLRNRASQSLSRGISGEGAAD